MNLFWQSFIQIKKTVISSQREQKLLNTYFRQKASWDTMNKNGYLMGVRLVNTEFHFITVGFKLIT